MDDWCVCWGRDTQRMCALRLEHVVMINANAVLDDVPGLYVIRINLTEEEANRQADAFSPYLSERAQTKSAKVITFPRNDRNEANRP